MMRKLKAAALLMCCSALSACATQRVAVQIPIPAERMDCAVLSGSDARPTIPAERAIDWSKIKTIAEARADHDAFVATLRERERPVANYVVRLEGQLFACADDAAWLRDYTSQIPSP